MDTGGNELAPWVHRCGFLGFRLGSGLAFSGVQVGFRLGSGLAFGGSGWVPGVQVGLFGIQLG